ncbi:MAG: hypothetical protein U0531_12600 [Dehalococcoidia bacterium]
MRLIAFHTPVTATAETAPSMSDMLVDLDEFVHPGAGPAERERLVALAQLADGTPAVRLPADPDRDDGRAMRRAGISTVALSDVRSGRPGAGGGGAAGAGHTPGAGVAHRRRPARRGGAGGGRAGCGGVVVRLRRPDRGLRRGAARPLPLDNPEPRLASPAWARGRMLTIARALGLEPGGGWTSLAPPPPDRLRYTLDCARNSG